jgi:hypothetical protein
LVIVLYMNYRNKKTTKIPSNQEKQDHVTENKIVSGNNVMRRSYIHPVQPNVTPYDQYTPPESSYDNYIDDEDYYQDEEDDENYENGIKFAPPLRPTII